MDVKNKKYFFGLVFLTVIAVIVLLINGCVKEYSNQIVQNRPPQTYFWVYSDTGVATGVSKQQLRWWGEDPDGFVIGYLVAVIPNLSTIPNPDTLSYSFVTVTDSVISFPLLQARQNFLVAVRAIDNTFSKKLPIGSKIKITPYPFWDKNENGIFDGNDVRIDELLNAMDPNGAKQKFPIKNTPPKIAYTYNLYDPTAPTIAQPPPLTYTVTTFSWVGSDFDGDETIAGYRISLNDSLFTNPLTVTSTITTITLMVPRSRSDAALNDTVTADVYRGVSPNLKYIGSLPNLKLNANNNLYVQTVDVAGDRSPFLRFPTQGSNWFVRKPTARILIIEDYMGSDKNSMRNYYRDSVFAKLSNITFRNYDILDIRIGASSIDKPGINVPAPQHINPQLTQTFKLYECVFWYTDGIPSISIAQNTLFDYRTSSDGGRIIFSTVFTGPIGFNDPKAIALRDFAPIDSVGSIAVATELAISNLIYPDSSDITNIYPVLSSRVYKPIAIYPFYKNSAARNIYVWPSANLQISHLGIIDDMKRIVFVAVPLSYFSSTQPAGGGVVEFFNKAFIEMGLQ